MKAPENKDVDIVRKKYQMLHQELDERGRRLWAAVEAKVLGYGGITTVAQATGLAASTIRLGQLELNASAAKEGNSAERRLRTPGGGRKRAIEKDATLLQALDKLVDPTTRGDPMSPLRWTCKSTRHLAQGLELQGHQVSHTKVGQLLKQLGYSLQGTRKTQEGISHPDRDKQFTYLNQQVQAFQRRGQPVVSVDAKKKELIGAFAQGGQEYQPKEHPEAVQVYDFLSLADGKGIPYGVYDLTTNKGWVSVGTDHDTAQFAVQTIRQWWCQMGQQAYPQASELLITADGGGSNGRRCRLWKYELQKLADESGLDIAVCHFPPGTSKWNKIEHRMFSYITKNWRGRPLTSYEVIVNLIANTQTETGLQIKAQLDTTHYPIGIKITNEELDALQLEKSEFHGEWNYTLKSHKD
jgi:transposase